MADATLTLKVVLDISPEDKARIDYLIEMEKRGLGLPVTIQAEMKPINDELFYYPGKGVVTASWLRQEMRVTPDESNNPGD